MASDAEPELEGAAAPGGPLSVTVGRVPKRRVRTLRSVAGLLASAPILLGVLQVALHPFDRSVWLHVWEGALVGGTFSAMLLAITSAVMLAVAGLRGRDAVVQILPDQLAVVRPPRIVAQTGAAALGHAPRGASFPERLTRAEVRSGVLRPFGRRARVELELLDGDMLFLDVLTESDAQRMLGALGQDAASSTARLSVREPAAAVLRTAWAVVAAVVGCLLVIGMLRPILGFTSPSVVIGMLLGTYGSAFLAAWASGSAELAIGVDGLVVVRPGRTRFVSFRELTGVERDDAVLDLALSSGRTLRLRGDPPSLITIERRIEQARGVRTEDALPASLAALSRGDRSVALWRRELLRLRGQTFRSFATSSEDLVRIVADPSRDLEQRIGAALVLKEEQHPEALAGLRVTDNLAHARTRALVDRLVQRELSDEAVAEVLAELSARSG